MVVVKLAGGIGNQLFQFCLYNSHKSRGHIVKFDTSSFGTANHENNNIISTFNLVNCIADNAELLKYNIPDNLNVMSKVLIKVRMLLGVSILSFIEKGCFYFHQGRFNYFNTNLLRDYCVYLDGTWMNKKLALENLDTVRLQMRNINKPLVYHDILNRIEKEQSVSVHVRKGDYKLLSNEGFFVLEAEYYINAIKIITNSINHPKFYIFGDIDEEINNIFSNLDFEIVNLELYKIINRDFLELDLMSRCKHNVIANSSFSLWAHYLNNNPSKIVVGPNKWMTQYYAGTKKLLLDNSYTV